MSFSSTPPATPPESLPPSSGFKAIVRPASELAANTGATSKLDASRATAAPRRYKALM